MRPVASTIIETGTLPGKEYAFSVSMANAAWLMRSMADLYSDRELACVREYSTNAYDSNKEKALAEGTEVAPIEVTLPDVMSPTFIVKDNGVGMSRKEMTEVYTQFGESTKRDSDDFNGMLGFGCKAAVAYTNNFTVTSVKDGLKNVGVVSRSEDAMGGYMVTMKIVIDNMPTTDPPGVTVEIPVHNVREFARKASDFYRFWQEGSVRVNARNPEPIIGDKIGDNLYQNTTSGMSYVVMGNVPYRVINADALFPAGMNRISFIAYVDMGAVEFTPSREDLKYSEHTKASLKKIVDDFVKASVDNAKSEISGASTHADAYTAWVKWRRLLGAAQVADLTFRGDEFVDRVPLLGSKYDSLAHRNSTNRVSGCYVSDLGRAVIITNFPSADVSSSQKKKARDWAGLPGKPAASVFFFTTATSLANPWVDQNRVVDWETVKKEAPKPPKKPRAQNVAWGRKAGTFDLLDLSIQRRKYEQDVPNSKRLLYIMVKDLATYGEDNVASVGNALGFADSVVIVPANRLAKFLRNYPNATELMGALKPLVKTNGKEILSSDAKVYLRMDSDERRILSALNEKNIEDKSLVKFIKIARLDIQEATKEYNSQRRLSRMLGLRFHEHGISSYDWPSQSNVANDYPLTTTLNRYGTSDDKVRHAEYYINAVFAARKDGKVV